MARNKYSTNKAFRDRTYKPVNVMFSISDHTELKAWCKANGITMSDYIYRLVIKDMANNGILLEGTIARNVDDIINDSDNGSVE